MRQIDFCFAVAFGLNVMTAHAGEYKAGSLDISDPCPAPHPRDRMLLPDT
jgi:hypothetical protein